LKIFQKVQFVTALFALKTKRATPQKNLSKKLHEPLDIRVS
jgi:hypothetical protein